MKIYGYQKTTLLDYPQHVAATIFTGGCNFCCPFCHNSDLIACANMTSFVPEDEIFSFLKKRKNVLTGVCITGGEPTLQPDIETFIKEIHSLGYKIKLDTNGSLPHKLEKLLQTNMIDYIAMDVKAGYSNYSNVSGIPDCPVPLIQQSIDFIENSGINYEFRTTVVKELHTTRDFLEIREMILPESPYYLQSFQNSPRVLTKGLSPCDKSVLQQYLDIIKNRLHHAYLRGIE